MNFKKSPVIFTGDFDRRKRRANQDAFGAVPENKAISATILCAQNGTFFSVNVVCMHGVDIYAEASW